MGYSPKLGRFLSADTIVPGAANPQAWNRYSYVLGNPLRYTDPTGHAISCDAEEDCKEKRRVDKLSAKAYVKEVLKKYKVRISDGFSDVQSIAILAAVVKVGAKFASERGRGESGSAAFGAIYGHMNISLEGAAGTCGNLAASSGGCTDSAHAIRFWSMSGQTVNDIDRMTKNVVHELGHAFDNSLAYPDPEHPGQTRRPDNDMSADFTRVRLLRPNITTALDPRWDLQQSPSNDSNEIFADMFVAWTYDAWNTSPEYAITVNNAQNFMNCLGGSSCGVYP